MTRIPRSCRVCRHPARAEIDAALLGGELFRGLVERFGTSLGALHRHRAGCIPADLRRAAAEADGARRIRSGDDLLRELEDLQRRTLSLLNDATDARTRLAAIGEARRNLALFAELLGELRRGPAVNIGVSVAELHTSTE